MIETNELITLFIGIGTCIFIVTKYSNLINLPKLKLLVSSFSIFLLGWVLTILEGIFYQDLLNMVEHLCYFSASLLLVIWIVKVYKKREGCN
ncbi:MAG: hypothetical protein R6U96_08360 [Promethearchaeia archaeon]